MRSICSASAVSRACASMRASPCPAQPCTPQPKPRCSRALGRVMSSSPWLTATPSSAPSAERVSLAAPSAASTRSEPLTSASRAGTPIRICAPAAVAWRCRIAGSVARPMPPARVCRTIPMVQANQPSQPGADLVIRGVTVVSTRDGSLQAHQDVAISGDRIVSVGPASPDGVPRDASVVDADGKYLVPGFNDMHAHMLSRPAAAAIPRGRSASCSRTASPASGRCPGPPACCGNAPPGPSCPSALRGCSPCPGRS